MKGQASPQHKDPVCGMRIGESDVRATTTYHGKTYYFCSIACKQKFEHTPGKYVAAN
ncbi:MAG: YHS domain-containing protein [Acidobacteria bacterium]|nr:YHS domain-containing protein [Acidobacteriota bacterium]